MRACGQTPLTPLLWTIWERANGRPALARLRGTKRKGSPHRASDPVLVLVRSVGEWRLSEGDRIPLPKQ
jgi:hypothetical protein